MGAPVLPKSHQWEGMDGRTYEHWWTAHSGWGIPRCVKQNGVSGRVPEDMAAFIREDWDYLPLSPEEREAARNGGAKFLGGEVIEHLGCFYRKREEPLPPKSTYQLRPGPPVFLCVLFLVAIGGLLWWGMEVFR